MVKVTITDNGEWGQLAAIFGSAADEVPGVVGDRHRQVLNESEDIMHDLVHKISGYLDSTIRQVGVTDTSGGIEVTADYASLEEYRPGDHSFFRPGVLHYTDTLPDLLVQDLTDFLQTRVGQSALSKGF